MFHGNPNAFVGNPLDRAGNERRDPAWVKAQEDHPQAEMIVIAGDKPLVTGDGPDAGIGWLTLAARGLLEGPHDLILLGLENGEPRFALDATGQEEAFADLGEFVASREIAPYLTSAELSVAGQALWLASWHRRHRFCARDGGETVLDHGGFKRVNPATGAEHFPRTDPVAIVLPIHGEEVCLGRSPHFPPAFYSAFAGFLEPCETLEECAARELKEEAGLITSSLEYVFSQPWPFPSSLMVGFFAEVTSRELALDPEEIEDARWVDRDTVRAALNGEAPGGLLAPPPMAIAHQLLKLWACR